MAQNTKSTETSGTLVPVESSSPRVRPAASRQNPPVQSQQGVTPRFVLQVLSRWWKIAMPLGVLMAGIACAAVWWTFEKQYEADTRLLVKSQQPFLAFAPEGAERGAREIFVQTQVQMIRDPLVLASVASQPEAAKVPELREAEDPVKWLAEHVVISPAAKSDFLEISLTCSNPRHSALLVNAIAHEYLLRANSNESEQTQTVIATLKEEREERRKEVERLREDLRALTKQITGEDPFAETPTANPNLDHPLAELNKRLIATEVEQTVAEARVKAIEEQLADMRAQASALMPVDESDEKPEGSPQEPADPNAKNSLMAVAESAMIAEAIEQDQEMQRLEQQISVNQARLEDREARLPERVAADEHGCQELRNAIREDQKLLDERREVVRDRLLARMAASRAGEFASRTAQLEQELAAMQSKLTAYEKTKELLLEQIGDKQGEAKTVSGDTLELLFKRDELAKAEEVFDALSARILRLSTEQRAPDQVSLWRAAEPAIVPVEKYPFKGLGLASLLFFVPFGLAGGWEFLLRRVSNTQQLEQSANVAVIGEVARLPVQNRVARRGTNSRVDRGLNVFEESIDGLRTHLMLSEGLMGMAVLAVTSAAENEGKTSVAAQLAVNMALVSGKRTLLIDGDMRSPDIHNIFEIRQEPGLAEILSGECSVEDAIVRNDANHTDVIPAGRLRTSPHRLLGNGALHSFMKEVRSTYDYIIIDTPPILAASESLVLAREADRSLVCAMKDSSRIDQVKKAHERLVMAGGEPVGVVLNGVPTSHYVRQYGAYAYSRE